MGNLWITSDLHEGHRRIGRFREFPDWAVKAAQENPVEGVTEGALANSIWLDHYWRKMIKRRDHVIVLGDAAFDEWGVDQIAARPGIKMLYGGNHDDLPVESYLRAFSTVRGCKKQSKVGWLSHFPLHEAELRDHFCIHGHVHSETIDDWRYINVCCDNLFKVTGVPFINVKDLKELLEVRRKVKKVVY